jgi:uncharacterized membrane protein YphA (DoxX/SURF4 family)
MNTALWIAQILLGLAFLLTGTAKATWPRERLVVRMAYVNDFPQPFIRFIGVMEFLGGLGLILPSLTGILPILTPIAAVGLIIIMIGAAFTHLRRKEQPMIVINLVLLAAAAFIAYGRFVLVPITAA